MNIEDIKKTDTKPLLRFPKDYVVNPATLTAGRYGTLEMVDIWGADRTFQYSLRVQGQAAKTLARLHPEIVHPALADEMFRLASTEFVSPDRIRELEEKGSHDVIAINTAWEEVLPKEARSHVNKFKTSADTTEPAKALQLKSSLEVIARSVENLRDIVIEKSVKWIDIPYMDVTHKYDALPTVAGRPLAHYVEAISEGLEFLRFVYHHSIVGKWGDATGNHHSASAVGVDGLKLQEEYCKDLGIKNNIAPAQVPSLEYQADIVYAVTRLSETMNNLANFIADGRSDDVNIFVNQSPKKQKGSSAMPHKDSKNGNPDSEEQFMSQRNFSVGNLVTAVMNCEMPYARNLEASSNMRIILEDEFKFLDHVTRRLSNIVYWIGINEERSRERVARSYGVVTSQQVMTYLTDGRKTSNPMSRSEAHDLMGNLATLAWSTKTPFIDVLLQNSEVTSRLDEATLREITDPFKYVGLSKEIVRSVAEKYYGKKTLG